MKSKDVGSRIKIILKERNLSQRDVSDKTGQPQSVISDIINGRRDYDKLVNLLSEVYGWSRDYIITGRGELITQNIANSDNSNSGLSKEEKLRLVANLEELYRKHQQLLDDASQVMKEIAAINKLLIVGAA